MKRGTLSMWCVTAGVPGGLAVDCEIAGVQVQADAAGHAFAIVGAESFLFFVTARFEIAAEFGLVGRIASGGFFRGIFQAVLAAGYEPERTVLIKRAVDLVETVDAADVPDVFGLKLRAPQLFGYMVPPVAMPAHAVGHVARLQ